MLLKSRDVGSQIVTRSCQRNRSSIRRRTIRVTRVPASTPATTAPGIVPPGSTEIRARSTRSKRSSPTPLDGRHGLSRRRLYEDAILTQPDAELDQLPEHDLLLGGVGFEGVDGLDQLVVRGRGGVVVDQAVVDLVHQVAVDQRADPEPVVLSEHGHHLVDREERGVAPRNQIVNLRQTLASTDDGEGEEGTEQKAGHAGERDVHPDVATVRPYEPRRDRHDHPEQQCRQNEVLAAEDGSRNRPKGSHKGRTISGIARKAKRK